MCQALLYYTNKCLWGPPHPKQSHSYKVWHRVPQRSQGQRPNVFGERGQILYYILIILINLHFKYSDCWFLCMENSFSSSSYFCHTCIFHVVAPTSALRKGILCLPLYKEDSSTLPHCMLSLWHHQFISFIPFICLLIYCQNCDQNVSTTGAEVCLLFSISVL